MMSHDAYTSGTFWVLTVASLQRLKMEAPTDCEVRQQDNASTKHPAPLNGPSQFLQCFAVMLSIHHLTSGHTQLNSQTHLLQEFNWEVFNHPPYSLDLAPSDFHLFLHLKNFLSSQCQHLQKDRDECHTVVPIPGDRLLQHRIRKLVPRWQMSRFQRWIWVIGTRQFHK